MGGGMGPKPSYPNTPYLYKSYVFGFGCHVPPSNSFVLPRQKWISRGDRYAHQPVVSESTTVPAGYMFVVSHVRITQTRVRGSQERQAPINSGVERAIPGKVDIHKTGTCTRTVGTEQIVRPRARKRE